MVEPVNLRQFRKQKNRLTKEQAADDNRKHYGISTKLKNQAKLTSVKENTKLDGHKLSNIKDD